MEDENIKPDYGEVHCSWKFIEFPNYERSQRWYLVYGIVIALILFLSIFTRNFLFALIVVMAAMIIALFHRTKGEVEFLITEDGIMVNDRFYDYKDLKNFFIIYEPPQIKSLYFEPKSLLNPRIPINLEDQDPVQIREILKQYLQEDLNREYEPITDQLSRFLKF